MSFKSRQRASAKHSHLFGDDPLSAAAAATSNDDPLFGSTSSSNRSFSSSPGPASKATVVDPLLSLSRSRPNSPFDSSNGSAPGSPRHQAKRTTATTTNNGSIFGDIDVSKLGGNSVFSSKRATLKTSPTPSLHAAEDDEDVLFGGGGRQRRQQQQQQQKVRQSPPPPPPHTSPPASSTTLSNPTSSSARSSVSDDRRLPSPPLPERRPVKQTSPPTDSEASLSSSDRPQSSLFSRFIKKKAATPEPPPPPPRHAEEPSRKRVPPPVPPRQSTPSASPPPPPPRREKPHQYSPKVEPEEEEEEEDVVPQVVIEDEATRAFAADIKFNTPTAAYAKAHYDDPELLVSLTNDLHFDNGPSMIPSASTPTGHQRSATASTASEDNFGNPWSLSPIDPLFSRTASTSSPLLKSNRLKVVPSEIEPAKRSAFADLIESWNGVKRKNGSKETQDDQFFDHVAAEQRDIGFAGIGADDEVRTTNGHREVDWDIQDSDNPWR
ncbi:hypothetical protein BJV82DRAFT_110680 [Fennellomyces sp. T-0311]|nr:hypothetical protein BJV82DRAFT_110680 [Fennellomyces sp. T-0311]